MEIECKGCYYTLCSFVCLTEDLSEILQFLWKHGCLRRSYLCEKCGRKCAIGDKDLFFRCNRNTLDPPIHCQEPDLPLPANNGHHIVNCSPMQHIKVDSESQIGLHHQINEIVHQQYGLCEANTSDIQQSTGVNSLRDAHSENIVLMHHDNRLQQPVLNSTNVCTSDTVNVTIMQDPVLSQNEINQSDRLLTVIDSQGTRVIHDQSILPNSVNDLSILQAESMMINQNSQTYLKQEGGISEEPPQKLVKRVGKQEGNNKPPKKRCNFKVSMKKGTFFEKSKLPIDTVCKFVVFWCCMKHPTQEFLRNELSLATRTVVDWSTACREICIHWAKSVSEKIGGDGVMVQVDEVKIQENKESKQNDNGNRYSFWGMEKDKEKGKIFIVPVPACDSWSLLTVVNDWVLPGSVIISNCWKTYDCLKLQEFVQQTAVQAKTFVHPQNNSGQQSFDGKSEDTGVSSGCELQMPRFGTRRSHHLGDLAEFMFKRRYSNHLERMHAFFRQISLAYPLR